MFDYDISKILKFHTDMEFDITVLCVNITYKNSLWSCELHKKK